MVVCLGPTRNATPVLQHQGHNRPNEYLYCRNSANKAGPVSIIYETNYHFKLTLNIPNCKMFAIYCNHAPLLQIAVIFEM